MSNDRKENVTSTNTDGVVMPEHLQKFAYACVMEMLWIAKVWNDHNFDSDTILHIAQGVTKQIDFDIDEINDFLDVLKIKLNS